MQTASENRNQVPIVAIGASAGGLEALESFFSQMPADSGFAFVVIQHLSPQHTSALAQLLGRNTRMSVVEVQDGTRPEVDHVYVIAPGTVLGIANGQLRVRPTDDGRHDLIDAFFKALADDLGRLAIGIILSGSGADGTSGLRAIQNAGGLTLAQVPETAAYDNMPRSAIDAGVVQQVLPIREMPAKLVERAKAVAEGRIAPPEVTAQTAVPPRAVQPSDEDLVPHLDRICEIVQHATGHDFSHYKRGTVVRRLRRRMQLRHASSPDDYLELLETERQEAELLTKDLLIGVTRFFRDPEVFDYLKLHVLPQIFAAKHQGEHVRIWVPGCASGEEAYSIGILVREHLDDMKGTYPVRIFATDIDAEAIAEARAALYQADIASVVSPARLARFFTRKGSSYHVASNVRDMCIFSEHSLIRDPPFLTTDLISCRNVLIYLEAELQKRLVPVLHYALRPQGFLLLGASEGLAGYPELFETVDKRLRVFRRVESVTRPIVEFPLGGRPAPRAAQPLPVALPAAPSDEQVVSSAFERLMLQEYVPPAAVVTAQGDVVRVAGLTGRYLQPPAGKLTTNILEIAHASLRIELRSALHAAVRGDRRVVKDNVLVEVDGGPRRLRLTIRPLHSVKGGGLFAVVLQEQGLPADTGEAGEPAPALEHESQIEQLESELRTTRNQLRSSIEELEATNEELQSSNEEMLSTNEEIQSSNEELQSSQEELRSVNEELATVNTELSRKLDELGRANSDLQNLFSSTDIATVFLDRELRVTRFTPAAQSLFRLIEADSGRSLSDLAPRFANLDLPAVVADVLHTLHPIERQVETVDRQAWYLLRVLPYRTVQNVIGGAVITLTEITQVKRAEAERERLLKELREAHDQLMADLDATNRLLRIGVLFLHEGNLESVLGEIVDAAIAISGADCGTIQLLDRRSGDLKIAAYRGLPAWWVDHWNTAHPGGGRTTLERKERVLVEDIERDPGLAGTPALEIQRRAGVRAIQSMPLLSRTGEPIGTLSIYNRVLGTPDARVLRLLDLVARQAADILEREHAEQALKDSEARLRTLVDASSDVVYRMSPDWSETRELKSHGLLARTDVTGQPWLERYIPPKEQRHVKAVIDQAIQTKTVFELEHQILRADGTQGWAWSRAVPLTDANGDIVEWFGTATDVTARKHIELELAEANQRLLEADRRKNEFLAVLSHELRNPLAPIRNCLDVLDHAEPGSDLAHRAHDVIHRQFDHLTHLIDDLLDVTRITTGKISLQSDVLDLNELTRRTVEDHRDAFVRGGIELAFTAAPAAVRVNGDPTRLAQVIGNLLQNAAKFTPSGGKVTVSVESDPMRAQARVRVSDTGRGIAPETLPHLFEPLTQAETALDRKKGGLGLGLAIAKGLVELHGGSVTAASEGAGKGASFTITLPREDSVPPPGAGKSFGATSRKALRMLVIDDNVDAADALRVVLELAGHQTEVAYSGPDGLQRARAIAPDVVFCDIGMDGMNGHEVARTLRADPELGRVALVAVTGYGASEDMAKARAAGFDLHVTKPLGRDRLEQVLTALEAARPSRA